MRGLLRTESHYSVLEWERELFFWGGSQNRDSLCSPGCPGPHSADQAGLELRNLPASASQALELKVYAATARKKERV